VNTVGDRTNRRRLLPIALRTLVRDPRPCARSWGRPRIPLRPPTIYTTEDLRWGRARSCTWLRTTNPHHRGAAFGRRCAYFRGRRMVRLGRPAFRTRLSFSKGPPRVPGNGQHVDLRTEEGSWWRGFRAITEPSTSEWGEVVVWVATEANTGRSNRKVEARWGCRGLRSGWSYVPRGSLGGCPGPSPRSPWRERHA
jgi:hypothetical protein